MELDLRGWPSANAFQAAVITPAASFKVEGTSPAVFRQPADETAVPVAKIVCQPVTSNASALLGLRWVISSVTVNVSRAWPDRWRDRSCDVE